MIRQTNDGLDVDIEEETSIISSNTEFGNSNTELLNTGLASNWSRPTKNLHVPTEFSDETEYYSPEPGDKLDIFWPSDQEYFSGTVSSSNHEGKHNIDYGDGENETISMGQEFWRNQKHTGGINNSAHYDTNVVVSQNYVSVSNSNVILNVIQNGYQDHNVVGNVDIERNGMINDYIDKQSHNVLSANKFEK